MPASQKLRVVVVGAGPSGLSACHHLLTDPEHFTFMCFEQCDNIGGTWHHAKDPKETESDAQPTSVAGQRPYTVYDGLRCNLLTDVMEFPDFKFEPDFISEKQIDETKISRHFATHYDMFNYLIKYADYFNLWPHIRLNEQVTSISLAKPDEPLLTDELQPAKYQVQTCNVSMGAESTEYCDAVLICNGHHAKPIWPKSIKNLQNFEGRIMHCKYYRGPDEPPVANVKKIVVIGQSASGPDLAVDIARRASSTKEVILAGHNPFLEQKPGRKLKNSLPTIIRLKPNVEEIVGPRSVQFADDSVEHDVDLIVAGTGFDYYFPFLSDDLALKYDDRRMQPLYKNIVHIDHPTLCFIGMHDASTGFKIFDLQIRYALAMLRGDFKLPSRAGMLQWEANDYALRTNEPLNWPNRYAHRLERLSKWYHDELVSESNVKPLDDKHFHKFMCLCLQIVENPENFREADYPP